MKKLLVIYAIFFCSCDWEIPDNKIYKYPEPMLTDVTPKKGQGERLITITGKYLINATLKINNNNVQIIENDSIKLRPKCLMVEMPLKPGK